MKYKKTLKVLNLLGFLKQEADSQNIRFWLLGGLACAFYAKIIYREIGDLDLITKDDKDRQKLIKILEKLNFKKIKEKRLSDRLIVYTYQNDDKIEIDLGEYINEFGMQDSDFEEDEKELNGIKSLVISKRFVKNYKEIQTKERNLEKDKTDIKYLSL